MSEREKIYFLMFSDATISDVISIYDDSKCTLSDESHSDRSVRLIDVMRLWSGSRELFRATYTDDVQIDLNHRGDMIEFFLPATEPLELEIKSGDPIASKGPVAISGELAREICTPGISGISA